MQWSIYSYASWVNLLQLRIHLLDKELRSQSYVVCNLRRRRANERLQKQCLLRSCLLQMNESYLHKHVAHLNWIFFSYQFVHSISCEINGWGWLLIDGWLSINGHCTPQPPIVFTRASCQYIINHMLNFTVGPNRTGLIFDRCNCCPDLHQNDIFNFRSLLYHPSGWLSLHRNRSTHN